MTSDWRIGNRVRVKNIESGWLSMCGTITGPEFMQGGKRLVWVTMDQGSLPQMFRVDELEAEPHFPNLFRTMNRGPDFNAGPFYVNELD